eukprot:2486930-Amphidinium_carterae.1
MSRRLGLVVDTPLAHPSNKAVLASRIRGTPHPNSCLPFSYSMVCFFNRSPDLQLTALSYRVAVLSRAARQGRNRFDKKARQHKRGRDARLRLQLISSKTQRMTRTKSGPVTAAR